MTGTSPFTLVLTGDLSVRSAPDLLARLRDSLAAHGTVALETATVTQADVTTIQTLLAARAKAEATGKSLILQGPPGARLQAVLESAGFLHHRQPAAGFWTTHN